MPVGRDARSSSAPSRAASARELSEYELVLETQVRPALERWRAELAAAREAAASLEAAFRVLDVLERAPPPPPAPPPPGAPALDALPAGAGALLDEGAALHALVDVGGGFRVSARVHRPASVVVRVGAGVHLDLTLPEARALVGNRLAALARVRGVLEAEAARTAGDLAVGEAGLRLMRRGASEDA